MEGVGKTSDIRKCLIFPRCLRLCAILTVILDLENSGMREWYPAVLLADLAQKMKFLMRQVSVCCRNKDFTLVILFSQHRDG